MWSQSCGLDEEAATTKVEVALRKGYITPAMRGWATALCAQDPDSFDAFIAKSIPAYAHLTKPSHMTGAPPGRLSTERADDNDAAAAICAQLAVRGHSTAEIARTLRVSDTSVRGWLKA